MGSNNHMKRLAMPRSWPLPRKTSIWVTKAAPGAHTLELCMPVVVVIRDILGYAKSTREVRHILHNNLVSIDGRICKDSRRGVGFMDVLTLGEENYRCIVDQKGILRYRQISKKEAETKVCRINGKTTVKGGKTQLHLHDGRNILTEDAGEYNTGDSLVLALPSQEIKEHIRFSDGIKCYLTGGAHVGEFAEVSEYIVKRSSMPNEVQFADFGTVMSNVFAIGKQKLPTTEVVE
ncbi:MAG: 30S ribosomal protein S4e [Candidatus Poseidoniaceae archaeon]|nr:30S ribosomal protein S4e [Candidatus Poseidoniaceae archaeon]MBL6895668.1 30S ribosomal protein S4e [Candidatus Poseidoniaceae archaeon]